MNAKQEAFKFIEKNKKAIKQFNDQELIQEYGRIIMKLAKRVDELESKENDINR